MRRRPDAPPTTGDSAVNDRIDLLMPVRCALRVRATLTRWRAQKSAPGEDYFSEPSAINAAAATTALATYDDDESEAPHAVNITWLDE